MSDRWKIEFKKNGKPVETLHNQTGGQLRRVRNVWAKNKKNANSEYYNTTLHYEAEPDVKGVK
jgi:hypothetical protein